jgi:hypothetical protein
MGIKHTYVDPVPDTGNPGGRVDSDDWNDDHTIDGDVDFGGFDILNVGNMGISNVVEDTSPTLGGSLDGGGFDITNVDDATFDTLTVTDDAYAVGWNGSALVPTKNAVYDKIELILGTTLPGAYQPLDGDLTSWAGVTRAAGFDTFAATPSSANLGSLVTDDLFLLSDIELGAIAGLTSAADKLPYFTGSGTAALADLSSAMRTFMTTPSSANFASLVSDDAFSLADAELGAIAGLTSAADKGIYFSGAGTAAVYDLTAYGRTLGGLADETALEALLDTLPNLTSIQGFTVTFADAGFDVLSGWDDSAGAHKNFALADLTNEGAPAAGDYVIVYGAEGDVRKVNWNLLPGVGGGISNVVEDTSPTLGGDLDLGSFNLLVTDGDGIKSVEAGNPELLLFTSVASAVNEITITNAVTTEPPLIEPTGSDTDISLALRAKGDGSKIFVLPTVSAGKAEMAFGDDTVNLNFFADPAGFELNIEAVGGQLNIQGFEVPVSIGTVGNEDISFFTDESTRWIIDDSEGGSLVAAGSQYISLNEMSAPAAGAADTLRLFARDNGAGKTQLCAIANGGVAEVIWTQA